MTPDTATDLLSRAAELRPLLEANAAKGEQDRRIAEESIQALADAGLFRITIPKRFGGDEVDIATKLEVSAAVAEGDGATGWVLALTNVCHWLVGPLPRRRPAGDLRGRSRRARVRRAHPVARDPPRGRRPRGQRAMGVGLGLAARHVGPRRRARQGRGRQRHRARPGAHPDVRAGGAGHVVRGRHEGHRLEHAGGRRGLRPRPPAALRAQGDRERLSDRAQGRGAVSLVVHPGARAHPGRPAARPRARRRATCASRRLPSAPSATRASSARRTRSPSSSRWPRRR